MTRPQTAQVLLARCFISEKRRLNAHHLRDVLIRQPEYAPGSRRTAQESAFDPRIPAPVAADAHLEIGVPEAACVERVLGQRIAPPVRLQETRGDGFEACGIEKGRQ